MKKLTIVRHGKSSWEYDLSDIERPLKKRGITDIKAVSKEFKIKYLQPEVVFSSPAKRALETSNIFLKNIDFSYENRHVSSQIYDFGGKNLISFIKSIDNKYKHVMIFGHNHAMTYFINTYGNMYIDNLPTSGLAIFEFDIASWKDLKPGKTIEILIPKNLRRNS
ncbi:MAG: histidine phosphatase family protein [Flavobacteriaceae bacterium]|nr:histidine phosphatase family protein [Flavobacteriaceae bacterium]